MKKIILILSIAILLISCAQSSPKIGDQSKPFISTNIKYIGDGWCVYTGSRFATINFDVTNSPPKLILPARLFNIGDTIHIKNITK